MSGRRTWHRIGDPSIQTDSIRYRYDAVTGELRTVAVRWRDSVRDSVLFRWDGLGRRDTLIYSPHISSPLKVTFAYDKDGRFRRLCSKNPPGTAIPDVLDLLVKVDWIERDGVIRKHSIGSDAQCPSAVTPAIVTNQYDSRHRMLNQVTAGTDTVHYRYDESDNMVVLKHPRLTRDLRFEMAANHNRVSRFWKDSTTNPSYDIRITYDGSGARADELPHTNNQPDTLKVTRRMYWYDGLGRLTGTGQYEIGTEWAGADSVSLGIAQWTPNGTACK